MQKGFISFLYTYNSIVLRILLLSPVNFTFAKMNSKLAKNIADIYDLDSNRTEQSRNKKIQRLINTLYFVIYN